MGERSAVRPKSGQSVSQSDPGLRRPTPPSTAGRKPAARPPNSILSFTPPQSGLPRRGAGLSQSKTGRGAGQSPAFFARRVAPGPLTPSTLPKSSIPYSLDDSQIANLIEFGQYAMWRTYKNYEASVALGRVLPPDTEVQGKLANGLSLENRIRPIFIGHGFGNFSDRKSREDVRYILTYTAPAIGYEGSQIEDVLAAYPGWRVIMSFDVAETPSGHDRAALIDKRAGH